MLRNPKDKALFDGLSAFKESLSETIGFFKTLVKPEANPYLEHTVRVRMCFEDIAFQMSTLLFYTRGEVSDEKLGKLLDGEQKIAFDAICEKINNVIKFANNATEETAFKNLADTLYEITSDMTNEADKLTGHDGVVRFLAGEIRNLADIIMRNVLA